MKAYLLLATAVLTTAARAADGPGARRFSSANARSAGVSAPEQAPVSASAPVLAPAFSSSVELSPVSSGVPPSPSWPPNARFYYSLDPWLAQPANAPRAIRHYFGFPENYQGTRRYHAYATLEPPSPIAPEAYYTDPEPGAWLYESRSQLSGKASFGEDPRAAYLRTPARSAPTPNSKIGVAPSRTTPSSASDSASATATSKAKKPGE
ncbi:MAG: hypothetical protein BWZ10_00960 [candidate division BRC1 bacterium ADurb.BinA364]|nr:MAG: hypothetical protein BWZ10_00960 [candidate division BRC1 bacterium ADurb.BinA364]